MQDSAGVRLGYRPALDGLRAGAVLAVMCKHAGLPVRGGGVIGVETFFVLSGFLITFLLVEQREQTGHVRIGNFYERRALRLLPALLAMAAVFGLYAAIFPHRVSVPHSIAALPSVIFYYANWHRAYIGSLGLFSHTWSLAVEEQFYLVWPLLFIGILRVTKSYRALIGVALGLAAISTLVRIAIWSAGTSVERVQGGFDTRAAGLLVGCVAGVVIARSRRELTSGGRSGLEVLGILAALGLAVGCFINLDTAHATYSYGLTLIDAAAIVFIVSLVLVPQSETAKLLSVRPVVAIGRISYGLYLWHYPAFWVVRGALNTHSGTGLYVLEFVAAFGLAVASYFFIERPALRLKARIAPRLEVAPTRVA